MMSDTVCRNAGLNELMCGDLEVCWGSLMERACHLDERTSRILSLAQCMSYADRLWEQAQQILLFNKDVCVFIVACFVLHLTSFDLQSIIVWLVKCLNYTSLGLWGKVYHRVWSCVESSHGLYSTRPSSNEKKRETKEQLIIAIRAALDIMSSMVCRRMWKLM